MDYSYSYQNLKRDLTDVLNNMVVNTPRFISLFAERAQAINTRHEWNENVIDGYTEKVTSNADGVLTLTTAGAKEHFPVGALLKKQGDSAVFRVTAVDSAANKITVTLAAAHGSSLTAATIAANDILAIIAVPKNEGTRSGDDGTVYTGTNHNFTQIIRRDVVLSGTSLAVKRYGMENAMTRQLEYKMLEITRELNKTAIDGIRAERTASVKGAAGGVYEFGNVLSHLVNNVPLTDKIVNDAAEKILNAGGSPDTIVCHSSQCRVLSNIMRDKILVQRGDQARGPYVMEVYSDITGNSATRTSSSAIPPVSVSAGWQAVSFMTGIPRRRTSTVLSVRSLVNSRSNSSTAASASARFADSQRPPMHSTRWKHRSPSPSHPAQKLRFSPRLSPSKQPD